ncbi:MAG: hypothetical protein U0103_15490 [Candidatus Obscuribacterales bacterium]
MQRLSKTELTALLTVLGLSSAAIASANPVSSTEKQFLVAEKEGAKKSGEMACGKGACGADEKGAAAAKEKAAKTEKKTEEKKTETKKKAASSSK